MKAIIDFACELRNGTVLATRKQPFICGDALAHMLRIDVTEGGQPADLAGTAATAYCVLSNRATATAGVTISGSTLLATFPASFYAVAGDTYVLIRLVRGDTKVDVLCLRYTVLAGATSTVYDPAGELPSLADFATAIAAANAAANAAMDAAGVANVKATLAESKASAAQQAATQAAQQAAIADGAALAAANAASSATAAAAALNGLTASAAVLAAGSAATATVTEVDGHKHIAFGMPAGPKGDTGDTGPQGPQGVPGAGNVDTVDGVLSDNDGNVALGAVRYGAAQELTEQQKAQARANIGACMTLDTYPVGSLFISLSSTSPAALFGGTWIQAYDVFLVGAGGLYSAGSTGGEASHVLTIDEMPSHSHTLSYSATGDAMPGREGNAAFNVNAPVVSKLVTTTDYGAYYQTGVTGAGSWQAHNNLPPYFAVYMWYRIA